MSKNWRAIFAIDPGPIKSAFVWRRGGEMISAGIELNADLRFRLSCIDADSTILAIEQVRSYGMSVGAEVFDTCVETGRFIQAFDGKGEVLLIPRLEVKMFLCRSPRANDSNIRTAILDLYGGKDKAIGKKKTPGPLYEFKKDLWAAMGVSLTAEDKVKRDDVEGK